jgi:hypothetical protein
MNSLIVAGTVSILFGFTPDPLVQERIWAVADVVDEGLGEVLENNVPGILEAAGGDRVEVLKNLIYCQYTWSESALRDQNREVYMAAAGVTVAMEFSVEEYVAAIPDLLKSEDEKFLALIEQLAVAMGQRYEAEKERDDTDPFAEQLRKSIEENGEPDEAIAAAVMKNKPFETARLLAELTGMPDRVQADTRRLEAVFSDSKHEIRLNSDIEEGRKLLEKFMQHDAWWMRLFALEVMIQDSVMALPNASQLVRSDSLPRIRGRGGDIQPYDEIDVGDEAAQRRILRSQRPYGDEYRAALRYYLDDFSRDKYETLKSFIGRGNQKILLQGIGLALNRTRNPEKEKMVDEFIALVAAEMNAPRFSQGDPISCPAALRRLVEWDYRTNTPPYGYNEIIEILVGALPRANYDAASQIVRALGEIGARDPSKRSEVLSVLREFDSTIDRGNPRKTSGIAHNLDKAFSELDGK